MMAMGCGNCFVFYATIFSVLCYMNTYLTIRLVVDSHAPRSSRKPRAAVLQIALDAPDARDDVYC